MTILFLKELDLSEGHSSGIYTIQEELEKSGSPLAEFLTDEDRRAMRIRIPNRTQGDLSTFID